MHMCSSGASDFFWSFGFFSGMSLLMEHFHGIRSAQPICVKHLDALAIQAAPRHCSCYTWQKVDCPAAQE